MAQNGRTSLRNETSPSCFQTHCRLRKYAGMAEITTEMICDTTPPNSRTIRQKAKTPWPTSTLITDTPQ